MISNVSISKIYLYIMEYKNHWIVSGYGATFKAFDEKQSKFPDNI